MKFLFCHIGRMTNYNGATKDDIPISGGSHNKDNIGHECCNFVDISGTLYGYVRVSGSISIKKLGASSGESCIGGVTVVWLSPSENGEIVVTGWYKDATVYSNYQRIPSPSELHQKDGIKFYNITAKTKNSFLLPPSERTLITKTGKGWLGQSRIWYADKPHHNDFIKKLTILIESKSRENPTQITNEFNAEDIPDLDLANTATEGGKILVTHIKKERNQEIINQKKKQALKSTGHLRCEICNFSFEDIYGDIGRDFCEVHHIKPLSEINDQTETSLDDLAIICSNCHRMIHRIKPAPSIQEFKNRFNFSGTTKK